eukprot:3515561-Pyramimonas_sp.AAC.1
MPHLLLLATQRGRCVGIVRRNWRHLSTGIQPRSVFRGNLDKRTFADLGSKDVKDAVMHYLDVCFVKDVMRQPNCITTGLHSEFNTEVNYPHIKFYGKVAA